MALELGQPAFTSPAGVELFNPSWCFDPTGTWSVISKRGDTLYISGLRGICPKTNKMVPMDGVENYTGSPKGSPAYPRVLKAFENMKMISEAAGASVTDCLRLVVYTTDMFRFRPLVNEAQKEVWGDLPFPPRTIVEVSRLNQDDIVEVESTFALPQSKA